LIFVIALILIIINFYYCSDLLWQKNYPGPQGKLSGQSALLIGRFMAVRQAICPSPIP
jgi:hypothetical protein